MSLAEQARVQPGVSPQNTVEKNLCEVLRKKIKDKKVRIGDLAKRMSPSISESQLRHLLKGGSPLSIDRFIQICRLLEFDPIQMLQGAQPEPKFTLAFTEDQEDYICSDKWRYKVVKALSVPCTLQDLSATFPAAPDLPGVIKGLIENKIVIDEQVDGSPRYRINANEFQLASMRFSDRYTKVLLELIAEMHDVTVNYAQSKRDMVKFIRNSFVVDYFTPEQMIALREKAVEYSNEARRYIAKNRTDPKFSEMAKHNLVGLLTMICPLTGDAFLKR